MNSLNSDYITAWSKFLLSGNYADIDEKLTQLAELGNINAICKWYLFNEINLNKNIDSHVLSYHTEDYKKQLAVSYYLYNKDKDKIVDLLQKQDGLLQKCSKISTLGCLVKKDIMSEFEQSLDKVEEIEKALLGFQFVEQNLRAIEKAHNFYKSDNDILVLLDYTEMLKDLCNLLPLKRYTYKWQKLIKKNNKKIISYFNINYNIADILKNERYIFALAKVLAESKDKKESKVGKILLTSLANREYKMFNLQNETVQEKS